MSDKLSVADAHRALLDRQKAAAATDVADTDTDVADTDQSESSSAPDDVEEETSLPSRPPTAARDKKASRGSGKAKKTRGEAKAKQQSAREACAAAGGGEDAATEESSGKEAHAVAKRKSSSTDGGEDGIAESDLWTLECELVEAEFYEVRNVAPCARVPCDVVDELPASMW